jgi:hypothetical protein
MRSRADAAAAKSLSERPPRTFDEVFGELNLTPAERSALVWHLAAIRMRKTVETLLADHPYNESWHEFAAGVLRTSNGASK